MTEDKLYEKLKEKAQELKFGVLLCKIEIHAGKIKQIDIHKEFERLRAD